MAISQAASRDAARGDELPLPLASGGPAPGLRSDMLLPEPAWSPAAGVLAVLMGQAQHAQHQVRGSMSSVEGLLMEKRDEV